jgi:O-acetyl-ADP-ribose deacetylase (regulator of RNase III)
MMIEMQGNLFHSEAPFIGHGVNCRGKMGSGIAVQFRIRYPEMYEQYKAQCERGIFWPGEVFTWAAPDVTVLNISSQHEPGANARLDYLVSGLYKALLVADRKVLAIPRIGCGIGGLDWESQVKPSILRLEEEFELSKGLIEVWSL